MKKKKVIVFLAMISVLLGCGGISSCKDATTYESESSKIEESKESDAGEVGSFQYVQTSSTTAILTGYQGDALSGEVDIPAQIGGLIVDRISSDLFKGTGGNITSISIPATVSYIDASAFINLHNLSEIEFQAGSNLKDIGSKAFANCNELQSFTIPSSVSFLASDAFLGCKKLSGFIVEEGNTFFSAVEGVLFNKAGTTLLYYPEGKTEVSYLVPASVQSISGSAFAKNVNIENVNLNNVVKVEEYAFGNCDKISAITAPKLDFVEVGAFENTAWLSNQTRDFVELGNVLISYQGDATELVIEDYVSIAPYAFADNESLTKVIVSENLLNIGESAFANCVKLDKVYLLNNSKIIYVSDSSFDGNAEGRKIYVPYPMIEVYLGNKLWQQYEDDIIVPETEIIYESNGGSVCVDGVVYYQDYLNLPTTERKGYNFTGWYADSSCTGVAYNEQTRWNSLEETSTFYAGWSAQTYSIVYITNFTEKGVVLDSYTGSYTIEQDVVYDIPEKEGYTFAGWYEDYALTQSAGNGFEKGNIGNKTLYAKWIKDEVV